MLFGALRAGVMCLVRCGLGSCVVWCVEGWGHVFGALRAGVMCCLVR